MNEFFIWALVFAGAYNVWMALSMKTRNMTSSMIFKVIPFFAGGATLFVASKLAGWI